MNSKLSLGRLEKVDLRTYWEREDTDFTPWLAEEDNIKLLSESIGLDLEVEAQEKEVGPFRADILCKDIGSDHWVLIENQLERTDHTHLGQLLTYAAGLNAVTIVWIASRFTEEHRATLDWLNEITNEDFNFFGLEIELWRIGDSAIAPKFNLASHPNDWSKTVIGAAKRIVENNLTPAKQLQQKYWQAFKDYASEYGATFTTTKALSQHWMNIYLGHSGCKLRAVASTYNSDTQNYEVGELRAEVYLKDKNAKSYFQLLMMDRSDIEELLGEPLIWENNPNNISCRIYLRRSADIQDNQDWLEQHKWLCSKLQKLYTIFSQKMKQLDLSDLVPFPGDKISG